MTERIFKDQPKRLEVLFQTYSNPLYFITFNTWHREAFLANNKVHDAFIEYALLNAAQGRAIGRYVIMPDHIHFFVRGPQDFKLAPFIRLLKQHITKRLQKRTQTKIWQPGFFDHVLRNSESYENKWEYVSLNPVRARLAENAKEWPFQGEIALIDRA